MLKVLTGKADPKGSWTVKGSLLNVIFHGPFLFIFYQERIVALTPESEEHSYGAGNWLEEKLCSKGMYYLTGIKTTQTAFNVDPYSHVIIPAVNAGMDMGAVPCYGFVLPPASGMRAIASVEIGSHKIFEGGYASEIKATKLGTAHVLTYKICDDDSPQLEDLQWLPTPSKYCGSVINLHVYAESSFRRDPDHPVRDFRKALKMLPKISLGLHTPFPELQFPNPQPIDDLGIIREEQGGLRGLPPMQLEALPPVLCDAPSIVVTGA